MMTEEIKQNEKAETNNIGSIDDVVSKKRLKSEITYIPKWGTNHLTEEDRRKFSLPLKT